MSGIVDFLDSLNETELAHFWQYRRGSYMPDTEARIDEYFKGRGLSQKRLADLLKSASKDFPADACSRCGSLKRMESEVPIWQTGQYTGIANQLSARQPTGTQAECLVCGFMLSDPNATGNKEQRADGLIAWILRLLSG